MAPGLVALLTVLGALLHAGAPAAAQPDHHAARPHHVYDYVMGGPWLKYYHVDKSVELARASLAAAGVDVNDKAAMARRLPLPLLYTYSFDFQPWQPPVSGETKEQRERREGENRDSGKRRCLHCALIRFNKLIGGYNTSLDIFLFVRKDQLSSVTEDLVTFGGRFNNVHVLELEDHVWRMPKSLRPEGFGWSAGFSHEYRLMGHWRLAFSFPFVRELGYKYLFQSDYDTFVRAPVQYDMVQRAQADGWWLTNKDFSFLEIRDYTRGIPELVHFWMTTRYGQLGRQGQVFNETTAPEFGIKGPLLKHINPPSIEGLHTRAEDGIGWGDRDQRRYHGWDGDCIAGNFNMFDLDNFWFQRDTQDFLQLLLRTNGHIEHRWVDVATESMMGHMFVPEDKFHTHKDIQVDHGAWLTEGHDGYMDCLKEGLALPIKRNSANPAEWPTNQAFTALLKREGYEP